MMTPKEYFEANKDKIEKTAEEVAKRDNKTKEEVMSIIEQEFINQDGTGHDETIDYEGTQVSISEELKTIRFLDKEKVVLYFVYGGKMAPIYEKEGNQVSAEFDLEAIINIITALKMKYITLNKFHFLLCHNHPFVYKAFPSIGDSESIRDFVGMIKNMNIFDSLSTVIIDDIGIVSPFDYWSFRQQ